MREKAAESGQAKFELPRVQPEPRSLRADHGQLAGRRRSVEVQPVPVGIQAKYSLCFCGLQSDILFLVLPPAVCLIFITMGRPAWANEAQWVWLSAQAVEYMKIKGDKKQTKKFWPIYLDGWQEQWPTPALSVVVKDTSTTDTTIAADNEVVPTVASTGKKARKPLTVGMVRMIWMPVAIGIDEFVAVEAVDK